MTLDTRFAAGMREQLIDTASGTSPLARGLHRRRIALGVVGTAAAAALLTAGTLVAVGGVPGEHLVTGLGNEVTQSFTGSATVELGVPTAAANAVSFEITCTSAGAFDVEFADGTGLSWECSDTPGLNERTTDDPYDSTLPVGHVVTVREQLLAAGETSFGVTTGASTTWTITSQYATSVTTPWGINANGQTYGTANEKGIPDLTAAQATNGEVGYIYSDELMNDSRQDFHTIPVYESDGVTVIGEFPIGDS